MTELQCRSGGGIYLTDREMIARWKSLAPGEQPDFAEVLSILVDFEGKTDQIFRCQEEDWTQVWLRETQPMVDLLNVGSVASVVFQRGTYHCDLNLFVSMPPPNVGKLIEQYISVQSGELLVGDLGKLAEDWECDFEVEHDSFQETVFQVDPGWYKATFCFPPSPPVSGSGRKRVFGSTELAACIVRCEKSQQHQNSIKSLPVFPFPQ